MNCPILTLDIITDQPQNAPVLNPTTLHSEQKCSVLNGALWDLVEQVHSGICELDPNNDDDDDGDDVSHNNDRNIRDNYISNNAEKYCHGYFLIEQKKNDWVKITLHAPGY